MMEPLLHDLVINAPARIVYELLTSAEGLTEWIGIEARVDPRPGGVVWWRHANGDACAGQFIELCPYTRIIFTYGWEREAVGIPPGSTTVQIDLEEDGEQTRMRLTHYGLSDPARIAHTEGWRHYLARLRTLAQSGEPGPDPFADQRVPDFR